MNISVRVFLFVPASVLIDTWWNVNQLAEGGVLKKGQGFNRYMVECEFDTSMCAYEKSARFNRYMVECES